MVSVAPANPQGGQFRALSVLIAVNFIDMLGFAMVLPLLPFYALELDATPETIGWMIASFSIAQLIASPIWGRVSDRYGRRPALMIGLFASAVAFLVFGLADTLWLLFLSRIVQGAGGGTTGVAQAYVSDTVGPAHRAKALGWLSAATSAGIMVGPFLGSAASTLGREAPGLIAAALCFLNVLAAWRWLPESRPRDGSVPVRKPVWHAALNVLRQPGGTAERLIWIYGIAMVSFALYTSVLALWLDARFGITAQTIGWFYGYNGMLALVMRSLLLGKVIDRFGEAGTMRLGMMVLAFGLLLFPFAPSVWAMVVIIPFVPIGTALIFPATTSLLSAASPPSEVGTMMGVAQTFAGFSRIAAPVLGTIAFQRLGVDAPFFLAALIVAIMGWVAWRRVRTLGPPAVAGVP
jgi:multidrug resistance protein